MRVFNFLFLLALWLAPSCPLSAGGYVIGLNFGGNLVNTETTASIDSVAVINGVKEGRWGGCSNIEFGYEWSLKSLLASTYVRTLVFVGYPSSAQVSASGSHQGKVWQAAVKTGASSGVSLIFGGSIPFIGAYIKMSLGGTQVAQQLYPEGVEKPEARKHFSLTPAFGIGFKQGLLGFEIRLEYLYAHMPTLKNISDAYSVEGKQETALSSHAFVVGLGFVF